MLEYVSLGLEKEFRMGFGFFSLGTGHGIYFHRERIHSNGLQRVHMAVIGSTVVDP